jgi:hypothetical protein
MTDRDVPGKRTAERTAGLSRSPIFKVADDTLMDLDFDPYRDPSQLLRIPDRQGILFVVYSPKAALTREVVMITEGVRAFGRDYYRSYVGAINKPQYLETAEQGQAYQRQLIAIVSPDHVVHAKELDKRMRELGGLPPRAITWSPK